ncbi:MAG: response regulator [Polyangiaceae bacterium]|nr:response regulator [Polyangiaceae bacterium]
MIHAPNVLLLDPDDLLRKATCLLLTRRGAGVDAAATLEEAISLSRRGAHDVALIELPPEAIGGRALLRRLYREGRVPARVVLSAHDLPDWPEVDAVSAVLIKPYPFERLMAAVFGEEEAAALERPARPALALRRLRRGRGVPRLGQRRPRRRREEAAGRARAFAERGAVERPLRSLRRAARGRPHPG